MIGPPVRFIARAGEIPDGAKESRIRSGKQAQGLQITGAGGLQVYQPAGSLHSQRIDLELVGASVQAKLIASIKATDNAGVPLNVRLQLFQIPDIPHTLLKTPGETRREADEGHIESFQFGGDIKVLKQRGGCPGLVYRNLHLKWALADQLFQTPSHTRRVGHRPSIFGKRFRESVVVKDQGKVVERELLQVALARFAERAL